MKPAERDMVCKPVLNNHDRQSGVGVGVGALLVGTKSDCHQYKDFGGCGDVVV